MYDAATVEFQVFVEQHANNGYVAEVIGLPNCQAVGKNEEEAISKAKELQLDAEQDAAVGAKFWF